MFIKTTSSDEGNNGLKELEILVNLFFMCLFEILGATVHRSDTFSFFRILILDIFFVNTLPFKEI